MTTKDMIFSHVRNSGSVSLTLLNDYNEAHRAGDLVKFISVRDRLVMRWASKQMDNISPFTKAVIHSGNMIYAAFNIRPVLEHDIKEIEITV